MIVMAVVLAVAVSMPVLSITMAAPSTHIARAMEDERGDLEIKLLAPLAGRTQWYGGAVIPVKVLLTDSDDGSPVVGANVTIWVNNVAAAGPGKSMVGNVFIDLGDGMYQFNLNTKPYPAGPGSPMFVFDVIAKAPDERGIGLPVSIHLN
jgi:hypothetical protein